MDGASRVFATGGTVELGGETYQANPRFLKFYGEMEQYVLDHRPDPIQVARESMKLFQGDPGHQDKLLEIGMDKACRMKNASQEEIQAWGRTVGGAAFGIWLMIRHNDPNYDPDNPAGSPTTITHEFCKQKLIEDIDRAEQQNNGEEGDGSTVAGIVSSATVRRQAEAEVIDTLNARAADISGEGAMGNSTGPTPTGPGNTTIPKSDESKKNSDSDKATARSRGDES